MISPSKNTSLIISLTILAIVIPSSFSQCVNSSWTQLGSRCYFWQDKDEYQDVAIAQCASLQARLSVVTSEEEMANNEAFIATDSTYNVTQWTGQIKSPTLSWVTICDGTPAVKSTWYPGEPAGYGICAMRVRSGTIKTASKSNSLPYFCEQSAGECNIKFARCLQPLDSNLIKTSCFTWESEPYPSITRTQCCLRNLVLQCQTEVPCALLKLFASDNAYFATPFLITDNIPGNVSDVSSSRQYTNLYAATIQVPNMTQPLYQVTYGSDQIMATDAELLFLNATPNRVLAYFPLNTTLATLVPMYLMWVTATNPVGSILAPYIITKKFTSYVVKSTLYAFVGAPGAPPYNATCGFLPTTSTALTTSSTIASTTAVTTSSEIATPTTSATKTTTNAATFASTTTTANTASSKVLTSTASSFQATQKASLTFTKATVLQKQSSGSSSSSSSSLPPPASTLTISATTIGGISTMTPISTNATEILQSDSTKVLPSFASSTATQTFASLSAGSSKSGSTMLRVITTTVATATNAASQTLASLAALSIRPNTSLMPDYVTTSCFNNASTMSTLSTAVSISSSSTLAVSALTITTTVMTTSSTSASTTTLVPSTAAGSIKISSASSALASFTSAAQMATSKLAATPETPAVLSSSTKPPFTSTSATSALKVTSAASLKLTSETALATTELTQKAAAALLTSMGIDPVSLSDSVSITTAITASIPFLLANMTDAEKSALFVSLDDTVNNCQYDGRPCDMTKEWKTEINPQYGNCFTFNGNDPPVNAASSTGSNTGLHMILKGSKNEYTCNSASAGFILQIHDPHEPSLPDTYGQYIPPGFVTNFAFAKTAISKLPPPYGTCIGEPKDVPQYYYDGTYIAEMCLRSCFQKFVLDKCGCGDPRYAIPDGASICGIDKKICVDNIGQCENTLINTSTCGCADGCKANVYLSANSASSLESDFSILDPNDTCSDQCNRTSRSRQLNAAIHVYFAQGYAISYTERPACDVFSMLYNVSNFPQVFTGFCIISLFEFFGLIIRIIMYKTSSYE